MTQMPFATSFLWKVLGCYLVGACGYALYCWAKKATRSGTAFERRVHALLLGFAWPVHLGAWGHRRWSARAAVQPVPAVPAASSPAVSAGDEAAPAKDLPRDPPRADWAPPTQ